MKSFCLDCRKGGNAVCNKPSHRNYAVHDNYRLPRKNHRIWKQIEKAINNDEMLPLWNNRISVPKPRCSCGNLHGYRAWPLKSNDQ